MILPGTRSRNLRAFTLLEVALSIVIVVGMLLVVLHYYQQAAMLRESLSSEVERVTTARQVLHRLARELITARSHSTLQYGLYGSSSYLEFVTTRLPSRLAWSTDDSGRPIHPQSDLEVVIYELAGPGDPSEATGLSRSEGPLPEFAAIDDFLDAFSPPPDNLNTTIPRESFPDESGESPATPETEFSSLRREFLTDQLRYLRFRFWNGGAWVDEWDDVILPAAIEVSLGGLPLPPPIATTLPAEDEYPYELFRRVIYLPGSIIESDPFSIDELIDEMEIPLEEVQL